MTEDEAQPRALKQATVNQYGVSYVDVEREGVVYRRCNLCHEEKPLTSDCFAPDSSRKTGFRGECRPCTSVKRAGYYAKKKEEEPEAIAGRQYRARIAAHGLTVERYENLLAKQGGVCAICKSPPKQNALHIDHDHKCCPGTYSCGKCVRGLLCPTCNAHRVSMLEDNEMLGRGLEYMNADSKMRDWAKWYGSLRDFTSWMKSGVQATDFDIVVHASTRAAEHYLVIETKEAGARLPLGQRIALDGLTNDKPKTFEVITVYGPDAGGGYFMEGSWKGRTTAECLDQQLALWWAEKKGKKG